MGSPCHGVIAFCASFRVCHTPSLANPSPRLALATPSPFFALFADSIYVQQTAWHSHHHTTASSLMGFTWPSTLLPNTTRLSLNSSCQHHIASTFLLALSFSITLPPQQGLTVTCPSKSTFNIPFLVISPRLTYPGPSPYTAVYPSPLSSSHYRVCSPTTKPQTTHVPQP